MRLGWGGLMLGSIREGKVGEGDAVSAVYDAYVANDRLWIGLADCDFLIRHAGVKTRVFCVAFLMQSGLEV